MNLILIAQNELEGDQVILRDHRGGHIQKILKSQPGDRLKIGLIDGPLGKAVVTQISREGVCLQVTLESTLPPAPLTDLILALPRPIMLKRVLSQAAALGVGKIHLINANRVEKSFFSASLLKNNNYRQYLIQGLEQAMDTHVPELVIHKRFRPFTEDILPQICTGSNTLLVAHPGNSASLWKQVSLPVQGRAVIAIGPEGGWIDYEVTKFEEQGFHRLSLGNRILRVDTAVPAILSQIHLFRQYRDSA